MNTTANIEHDLQILGMEYVDLMLLHWPCDSFDDTMATYRVLEGMALAGKSQLSASM